MLTTPAPPDALIEPIARYPIVGWLDFHNTRSVFGEQASAGQPRHTVYATLNHPRYSGEYDRATVSKLDRNQITAGDRIRPEIELQRPRTVGTDGTLCRGATERGDRSRWRVKVAAVNRRRAQLDKVQVAVGIRPRDRDFRDLQTGGRAVRQIPPDLLATQRERAGPLRAGYEYMGRNHSAARLAIAIRCCGNIGRVGADVVDDAKDLGLIGGQIERPCNGYGRRAARIGNLVRQVDASNRIVRRVGDGISICHRTGTVGGITV